MTRRLTVAQATITFLKNQFIERDGIEQPYFGGCFGIFGHGNVAGLGQALQENPDFRYYQCRNEQSMVHTAVAYAKVKNRLGAFVCTTSIGPGATNMITGAALATINRLPVLLLPGDIFSTREPNPVLQQLESASTQDISVNDCFKPVSKYWDRINRPEQLIYSLPEVMRVLTSQAEMGAVTLSMPQDVQTHAYDFPEELFQKKVWHVGRPRPDLTTLQKAAEWIKNSKNPVIVAGGGAIYSDASGVLDSFATKTGIPVGETFAGKGAVRYDAPYSIGGLGATGTKYAIEIANEADIVIGIGTRYSDFTTASKSIFKNPDVKFININISEFDAFKHAALPVIGDAKAVLEELGALLGDFEVDQHYRQRIAEMNKAWDDEVTQIYAEGNSTVSPIDQAVVIGTLNSFMDDRDVMINASGSAPGDLHKLWRATDPKNFHLEYGFSCMGYEIAAGMGAKMADPTREIYVICGDGGYLMNNHEIVTSIQEGVKFTILLLNNNGYASIGGLSESIGSERFGTMYKYRDENSGQLSGEFLPVDLAKNAESLGANVIRATDRESLENALAQSKTANRTTVIYIETSLYRTVKGYNAWWEVPIAEVSTSPGVQKAFENYKTNKKEQRIFL
ncbi:3D-(3,5/4)-trihydroxycyclohexane-1,2-dione acylhydrolase (decyclizing) [Dyadobacter chenwenxiniae]|uniref:3D-(3,5/4)-trihydroxycyclohexane-1,2-dione acylhydrolase (Decyclizing) n=1 Tax=Dyadobacter chenwenxiniae TaxID=2906456 RepID=A0A9X1PFP1_9BACT|nr:3D-(3,5/4)-trihydroxycyclohexane-1,2-dione acylhydrolase (decyclizing) [Dyadobacter chenwenxiniae]MCF0060302.1 3D-(3,5/4)-trihydroxycyclohexane-1,2-dione acylhydrolase (decyclizing) [Dyadobacter chenwenxiniae]UON86037.1 3D-(3,5/4)-trihydroxycyclohexane-1,2-dione acylhydrolase (decyclizing) [Dyadobacter chenwenxiniae]